mgnify:CR=1 FL=1
MDTKITPEMVEAELYEKGFTEFKPGRFDSEYILTKFQKRYKDEFGTKYFITVDKYDGWTHPHTGEYYGPMYEYNTQLTVQGHPVNLNFFSGWTIEAVEEKLDEIWSRSNFDYYEKDYSVTEDNPEERSILYGA